MSQLSSPFAASRTLAGALGGKVTLADYARKQKSRNSSATLSDARLGDSNVQETPGRSYHMHGFTSFVFASAVVNSFCLLINDATSPVLWTVLVALNTLMVFLVLRGDPFSLSFALRSRADRSASAATAAANQRRPKRRRGLRSARVLSDSAEEYDARGAASDSSNGNGPARRIGSVVPRQPPARDMPIEFEEEFPRRPRTLAANIWNKISGTSVNVRQGPNYSKNKVKGPSAESMFELVAVDLFRYMEKVDNVASFMELPLKEGEANAHKLLDDSYSVPPIFVVQFQIPDYEPAMWGGKVCVLFIWSKFSIFQW